MTSTVSALALLLALTLPAGAVHGAKGNDTGGIIPWTPANERAARSIAQANCAAYDKHAVIYSVHRQYSDYIKYRC